MSYTKQTWATGDVITANKLNHVEDGIESASDSLYVVNLTNNQYDNAHVADKTYGEIKAALDAGKTVIFKYDEVSDEYENIGYSYMSYFTVFLNEDPLVYQIFTSDGWNFLSGVASDYPTEDMG